MADEIVEMETDYEELPPAPAGVQTARDQEGEEASEEDNNDEEGAAHEEEEEEDGQDSDEEVAGMLTSPAVARKAPASSAQRGRGARARSSPESGEGEERLSPSKQRTPRRSTNSQLDKGKNKKQKRKSTPPPPPAAETFSSPEPEDDPRPKPTFDLSQLRKVARSRSRSRSARKESMRIAEESEEEEDEEDPDREDNEERPAIFKHWDSHDKQWRSDRVWLYHVFGSEQERNQLARQIEVRRNWWLGVHSAFAHATLLACCRTMVERWSRSSRTRISPSSLAARPSPSSSRFRRPKAEVRSFPLHLSPSSSLTCLSTVHQLSSPSANSGSKNASRAASNTTLSIGAARPRATKSRSTPSGRARTFVIGGRDMSLLRGRRRRSRGSFCGCWAGS